MKRSLCCSFVSCCAGFSAIFTLFPLLSASAHVNVLTQHNDPSRTGANLHETVLTPETVNVHQFGMLFKRIVDDQVYSQPLYVSNLLVDGGTHDVVYVTTVNNSVYAFDANEPSATAPLWRVNFGIPASFSDGKFRCTDINGNMGHHWYARYRSDPSRTVCHFFD